MARARGHDGDGASLYDDRDAKIYQLRVATDRLEDLNRGRQGDLFLFVKLLEYKTLNDGRCRLTREEIGESLKWGLWKVGEVRRLAERLGWIEVDRDSNRSGQGANKIRVAWERIKSASKCGGGSKPDSADTRLSESDTRLSESDTRLSESDTPYKEYIHNKKPKQKTKTNHGGGHGVLENLYFGRNLTREDLRDTQFLLRTVWPALVASGRVKQSEAGPHRLVTFAIEADRTFWSAKSIREPMSLFVRAVSDGRFMRRAMAECDDEAARRRIRDFERRERGHPPPMQINLAEIGQSVPGERDHRSEYDRQVALLARRKGLVPT